MVSAAASQMFLLADAHSAGFGAQALAFALGAERVAAILAEHDADVELVLLALHQSEEAVDAEESVAAVEDEGLLLWFEAVPGNVQRNAVLLGGLLQFGEVGAILWATPGVDRAIVEGLRLVGNDEVEVEVDGVAEALAARACAEGIVEGEEARLGLAIDAMAGLALEGGGEAEAFAVCDIRIARDDFIQYFARFAVADFCRVDDAGAVVGADDDAVDESEDRQREIDLEKRFGR